MRLLRHQRKYASAVSAWINLSRLKVDRTTVKTQRCETRSRREEIGETAQAPPSFVNPRILCVPRRIFANDHSR